MLFLAVAVVISSIVVVAVPAVIDVAVVVVGVVNRVFAIYQIMLGWKTWKYYYETDELPNPKGQPNPRKNRLKVTFGPLFPHSKHFFGGWDWFSIGNRPQES